MGRRITLHSQLTDFSYVSLIPLISVEFKFFKPRRESEFGSKDHQVSVIRDNSYCCTTECREESQYEIYSFLWRVGGGTSQVDRPLS